MNKRTLTACMLAALVALWAGAAALAGTTTVTFYHTSDYHEHTANMARIAKLVNDHKAKDPNVLLIDSGDWFNKGEVPIMFTRGRAMTSLLGACGYDALTLGNHESSFGSHRIAALIDRARLPVVAANVTWPKDATPKHALPYRIFPLKGVKVGVLGLTTNGQNHRADKLTKFASPEKTAEDIVPKLRKQVDILVLVTHIGQGRDRAIADEVPGIDLILGGHDHVRFKKLTLADNGQTVLQHSGAFGRTLGKVVLKWDGTKIVQQQAKLVHITKDMPEEPAIRALRDRYRKALAGPVVNLPKPVTAEQFRAWGG